MRPPGALPSPAKPVPRIDHIVEAEAGGGWERAEPPAEAVDEAGPVGRRTGGGLHVLPVGDIHRTFDGHDADLGRRPRHAQVRVEAPPAGHGDEAKPYPLRSTTEKRGTVACSRS